MFDLEMHIANWRREMHAVEGILPENLDEMEDHLLLQIEALEEAGLSGEEAFWVGRRRLGGAQPLAEEFCKVNGRSLWLPRLRWMIYGYLAVQAWVSLGSFLADLLGQAGLAYVLSLPTTAIVYTLLLACIPVGIWLGLRQVLRTAGAWQALFRQRRLWLGVGVAALVLLPAVRWASTLLAGRWLDLNTLGYFAMVKSVVWLVFSMVMPLFLAGLLAWLETRRRVTPRDGGDLRIFSVFSHRRPPSVWFRGVTNQNPLGALRCFQKR
jgi:hypothetical protein